LRTSGRAEHQEHFMTTRTPFRALAALAGFAFAAAVSSAFAQTNAASQPAARADVKAETRSANKSGQLPAGEATGADKQKPMASSKTRAERKAETLEASKKGELGSQGQALYKSNMSQRSATANSTKTRAERKAETKAAAKEGKLPAAGEGDAGKR
jgi:hypothetical protein